MSLRPFHLAFPVHDLAAARRFWGEVMGCPEGRSSDEWIDFDFYGHQIVAHLAPPRADTAANHVTVTTCRCRISALSLTWTTGKIWPSG
jgi:extradiol dioxygenase family protein